jgi:hypothetical protein
VVTSLENPTPAVIEVDWAASVFQILV